MVNNSWKTVTLSQIGTFQKGSGISRAESNSGVLPAVRYGELYTVHNNYVRTYTSHISREVANKALRVHYGDLLFACSVETKEDIAKCAAIIDNSEVYAGGDIIVLSPTTEVDPIFLGFILNTPNVIQQRAQKAQGDAIVHISADSIKSIEITVPEYAEQIKIAKVLYDIDTLIVNLEKLIAKKKAIKQGAMQELLTGKRRLPGFDGEWKEAAMDLYVDFQVGFPFSSAYFNSNSDGLRLVKNRDLKSDDQVYFTSEPYATEYVVENDDILIGMDGDFLPCRWQKGKALLNQRVGRLLPKKNLDVLFAYYALQKPLAELQNGTGATTVKHLSHGDIKKLIVLMPPTKEEQSAIAEILSDVDLEIEQLQLSLVKYMLVKQGMMSELLTGRIRLV